jgi:DNA polymerase-3 subunit beta
MVITAGTPEFGAAHIELDITATGSAIEVNFNSRYLQDLLKVMTSDDVHIAMSSKIAPAVFTSDKDKDYVYILMPLRG